MTCATIFLPNPMSNSMLAEEVPNGAARLIIWPLVDQQGTAIAAFAQNWFPNKNFDTFQYNALGESTTQAPTLLNQITFRQSGRAYDSFTKLYYNNARWYDPSTGRFISEDPIGFAGGDANLYRYVFNSYPNATDPSGHSIYGPGGWIDRNSYAYFQQHADQANWLANRSDTEVAGMAVGLAVPLGLGIFFGTPYMLGAGATYYATQAGLAAVETGVEGAVSYAMGADVDPLSSFAKNFMVNSATGGIGSKANWGMRTLAWAGRQGIEVAGETAFDVGYNGRDFGQSLLVNAIGSVAGDALGRGIAYGVKRGLNTAAGQTFQAYVGGFAEGLGSYRPRSVFAGAGLGGAGELFAGLGAAHRGGLRRASGVRSANYIELPLAPESHGVFKLIHGNSLASPRTAYLYRLVDAEGNFLKWGVTQNMAKRYSKSYMFGKNMDEFARGTRADMTRMERGLVQTQPGPWNHEHWAGTRLGGQP